MTTIHGLYFSHHYTNYIFFMICALYLFLFRNDSFEGMFLILFNIKWLQHGTYIMKVWNVWNRYYRIGRVVTCITTHVLTNSLFGAPFGKSEPFIKVLYIEMWLHFFLTSCLTILLGDSRTSWNGLPFPKWKP